MSVSPYTHIFYNVCKHHKQKALEAAQSGGGWHTV